MQQTLLRLPRAVPLGKQQLPWPRRYTTHSPFRVHDHLLCTDNTRTGMIRQIAVDMTAVLQYFACLTICYICTDNTMVGMIRHILHWILVFTNFGQR